MTCSPTTRRASPRSPTPISANSSPHRAVRHCCTATGAADRPTSVPWRTCWRVFPGWPTTFPSSPRPNATRSSPGRTASPSSTPGSACCHAAPPIPICVGFPEARTRAESEAEMKRRRVGSVMTDDVVSARSGTPVADIARWLAEYDINGLPVVDADDRVMGVVSATDLKRTRRTAAGDGVLTMRRRDVHSGSYGPCRRLRGPCGPPDEHKRHRAAACGG